ncbi:hypothetical protein BOTBODRAFT_173788 [Botryobasidium botryosum FD-172 SS1]|uniref:Uncharacterized protein n=1 Tax=Botryobasidium botryosum (strain FD-172 SS1) TaxID=930990 RepID=A0A067MIW2_BOTB1|nr:hypothetical protein BOTBODRAFT_173788 [Botryobasidium botryosum FD-172 SS1]
MPSVPSISTATPRPARFSATSPVDSYYFHSPASSSSSLPTDLPWGSGAGESSPTSPSCDYSLSRPDSPDSRWSRATFVFQDPDLDLIQSAVGRIESDAGASAGRRRHARQPSVASSHVSASHSRRRSHSRKASQSQPQRISHVHAPSYSSILTLPSPSVPSSASALTLTPLDTSSSAPATDAHPLSAFPAANSNMSDQHQHQHRDLLDANIDDGDSHSHSSETESDNPAPRTPDEEVAVNIVSYGTRAVLANARTVRLRSPGGEDEGGGSLSNRGSVDSAGSVTGVVRAGYVTPRGKQQQEQERQRQQALAASRAQAKPFVLALPPPPVRQLSEPRNTMPSSSSLPSPSPSLSKSVAGSALLTGLETPPDTGSPSPSPTPYQRVRAKSIPPPLQSTSAYRLPPPTTALRSPPVIPEHASLPSSPLRTAKTAMMDKDRDGALSQIIAYLPPTPTSQSPPPPQTPQPLQSIQPHRQLRSIQSVHSLPSVSVSPPPRPAAPAAPVASTASVAPMASAAPVTRSAPTAPRVVSASPPPARAAAGARSSAGSIDGLSTRSTSSSAFDYLRDVTLELWIDQEGFRCIRPQFAFVRYASPRPTSSLSTTGASSAGTSDRRRNLRSMESHSTISSNMGAPFDALSTTTAATSVMTCHSDISNMSSATLNSESLMGVEGVAVFQTSGMNVYHFHHAAFDTPPVLRRLTVNREEKRDYLSRQANLLVRENGTYVLRGSEGRKDKKCRWEFSYAVSDRRKAGAASGIMHGEKAFTPLAFVCSPELLLAQHGKKVKLLQVMRKGITPKLSSSKLRPGTPSSLCSSSESPVAGMSTSSVVVPQEPHDVKLARSRSKSSLASPGKNFTRAPQVGSSMVNLNSGSTPAPAPVVVPPPLKSPLPASVTAPPAPRPPPSSSMPPPSSSPPPPAAHAPSAIGKTFDAIASSLKPRRPRTAPRLGSTPSPFGFGSGSAAQNTSTHRPSTRGRDPASSPPPRTVTTGAGINTSSYLNPTSNAGTNSVAFARSSEKRCNTSQGNAEASQARPRSHSFSIGRFQRPSTSDGCKIGGGSGWSFAGWLGGGARGHVSDPRTPPATTAFASASAPASAPTPPLGSPPLSPPPSASLFLSPKPSLMRKRPSTAQAQSAPRVPFYAIPDPDPSPPPTQGHVGSKIVTAAEIQEWLAAHPPPPLPAGAAGGGIVGVGMGAPEASKPGIPSSWKSGGPLGRVPGPSGLDGLGGLGVSGGLRPPVSQRPSTASVDGSRPTRWGASEPDLASAPARPSGLGRAASATVAAVAPLAPAPLPIHPRSRSYTLRSANTLGGL